jgi:hypothetical protein
MKLSDVGPDLVAVFRKYLEVEPEGDAETFLDWVTDEVTHWQKPLETEDGHG